MRQSRSSKLTTPQNKPLIIGHRGASALAPENTLAAFQRALDDGADGLELDVRLAGDGVPVVIHDATLGRTGLMPGEVARMTSKELAAVDVGIWFNRAHPALGQSEYEKEFVPTLGDVFRLLHSRRSVIYVELKTDGVATTGELVRAVSDAVVKSSFLHRAVVISFDLPAVAAIKSVNSSIRTGALFAPRRRPGLGWRSKTMMNAAAECGADELLPHRLLARPKLIDLAADRDLPVVVWTVDDPSWVSRGRALGLHGLITNNPAKMLSV